MENNIQQPLPPYSQIDQPDSVSSATPNFSKTFIILMVVLIIAAVGVGGYILGSNQNQVVQNQTQPAASITPSFPTLFPTTPQITLQQELSDVLTYRASSWLIGYPQDWTIQKDSKTGGIFFIEPQNKAFMSVLPVKLREEELNKYSSKEKLKEFMLQVYSITGITYVREENSPLMGKNETGISMRLITKMNDFEGISDILLIKDTVYEIDFFVKTSLSDEEKKTLRSFYNEKILSTFVGK